MRPLFPHQCNPQIFCPENHFCFGFALLFELGCFSCPMVSRKTFSCPFSHWLYCCSTKLRAHVNRLEKRIRSPWMLRHYNNIAALSYFPRTKCILQQVWSGGLEHERTDKQTEIRSFQAAHCVEMITPTIFSTPLWQNSFLICAFTAYLASNMRIYERLSFLLYLQLINSKAGCFYPH